MIAGEDKYRLERHETDKGCRETRPRAMIRRYQVRPFAGPDVSHTISRMTATKVECREFGLEPETRVEEVASYAYTVQEEGARPQNGVLIEEFSETEERRSNLNAANRGVTIVSVSDDESTLKALSRDVSVEDVPTVDLPEDQKTPNGVLDEFRCAGLSEDVGTARKMSRIVEERSSEEPSSSAVLSSAVSPEAKIAERTLARSDSAARGRRLSKEESVEMESPSPKQPAERILERPLVPVIESSGPSREIAERVKAEAATTLPDETPSSSGQSARGALVHDDDNDDDGEIDDEMKDLLARVKRQRSVLDEILDKESGRESGRTARSPSAASPASLNRTLISRLYDLLSPVGL